MSQETPILLVEDDPITADYLKDTILLNVSDVTIVDCVDNVEDTKLAIKQLKPEIILMDIVLKDGTSFEVLDSISDPDFEVIFISAHGHFIEKALDYYSFNFITKPVDDHKLIGLLKKYQQLKKRIFELNKYRMLKEMIFETGQKILIQVGNRHLAVDFSDIIRCKADGNYTYFILTGNRKYLVSKPLGYYAELLERKQFFRSSRFDLINLTHIDHIYKKETVVLSNRDKINVSNRNRTKLSNLIREISL